ncbi:hypothetical protein MRB53_038487 [Persea americana]|nr:hypothetical protein MRB53_038487 [Persea americana]
MSATEVLFNLQLHTIIIRSAKKSEGVETSDLLVNKSGGDISSVSHSRKSGEEHQRNRGCLLRFVSFASSPDESGMCYPSHAIALRFEHGRFSLSYAGIIVRLFNPPTAFAGHYHNFTCKLTRKRAT